MRIKPPESLSLCCVELNVDGLVPAAPGVMMSWRKQTSSDAELGCFDHSHRELPSCVALVPNPDVLWCSLSVCLRQPLCLESQRFSAGTLNLLRWWSRHLTFVSVCHRRLCVMWTVTTWYGVELALEHYKWREKSHREEPQRRVTAALWLFSVALPASWSAPLNFFHSHHHWPIN